MDSNKTFFDWAIEFIIDNFEGGFVDDPDDKGGTTKYGISLSFLKFHSLDLTKDGIINKDDIKSLTKEKAKEIYYKHFWLPIKGDELVKYDKWVALYILDTHINTGLGGKLLQKAINSTFGKKILIEDNIIGNHTLSMLFKSDLTLLRMYLLILRAKYYILITIKRPKNLKYLKGWINKRVLKFIDILRDKIMV